MNRYGMIRALEARAAAALEDVRLGETLGLAVVGGRGRARERLGGCHAVRRHEFAAAGQAVDKLWDAVRRRDGGTVLAHDGGCAREHQAFLRVAFAYRGEAAAWGDGAHHALREGEVAV